MRTVLAPGVYDFLHIGHLRHLEAAKQLGDRLVVSVTPDKFVDKGPGRPIFRESERLACLQALRFVDDVILEREKHGVDVIELVHPDLYVCGEEYRNQVPAPVLITLLKLRVKLKYLDTRTEYSTTKLITGELLNERIARSRSRETETGFIRRRDDH
jgi:cytidyltransferase-like protein